MAKRISRSYEERNIEKISLTNKILTSALNSSFRNESFLHDSIFLVKSKEELNEIKLIQAKEIDRYSAFDLISSIEAMFKLDFYYRCENKLKDDLSKDFQQIYKVNPKKIRLKEDILSTWQKYNSTNSILNEVYSILKYRHWIAHGRYFLLKVNTNKYNFKYLYVIAQSIVDNFPLYLN